MTAPLLAEGVARTPEDVATGAGLVVFAVGLMAVVVVVTLALVSDRLPQRHQGLAHQAAVEEVAPQSGSSEWPAMDVNDPPGPVAPQTAYTGDPMADVAAIFAEAGCPLLPPDVHAVGHASVPAGPLESFRDLDVIRAGLSATQMLPTVGGSGETVRLR